MQHVVDTAKGLAHLQQVFRGQVAANIEQQIVRHVHQCGLQLAAVLAPMLQLKTQSLFEGSLVGHESFYDETHHNACGGAVFDSCHDGYMRIDKGSCQYTDTRVEFHQRAQWMLAQIGPTDDGALLQDQSHGARGGIKCETIRCDEECTASEGGQYKGNLDGAQIGEYQIKGHGAKDRDQDHHDGDGHKFLVVVFILQLWTDKPLIHPLDAFPRQRH